MKSFKIFSRGLNFHGQCGLGQNIIHTNEEFIQIPNFPKNIHSLYSGLAHNLILLDDLKSCYYFGFIWDIRTFLRTGNYLQTLPRFMKFIKNIYPTLKNYPLEPIFFHTFENKLKKIEFGGAHLLLLDSSGVCYGIGNNFQGQLGDDIVDIKSKVFRMKNFDNSKYTNIAAGFQHSILINENNDIFGCGKHDKYQLGKKYLEKNNFSYSFNEIISRFENLQLEIKNEKILDVYCGKYHSLFLTNQGNVYSLGVNRFGQLGESNLTVFNSGEFVKINFPDENTKIKEIRVGDNHNLFLTINGELYANGDNSSGQVNGDLDKFLYYECTPTKINFPQDKKILKIYAKNNRSAAIMDDGTGYYWGGFSYSPCYVLSSQPKYNGLNIFNEEKGIPANSKIVDVGLGFLHDLVLIEENDKS